MRARAGQQFERLLDTHGVGRYATAYRAAYPIQPPADVPDAASGRFLAVIAGRAIDGAHLYRDLATGLRRPQPALPPQPAIDPADAAAVEAAARAWPAWADARVFAPAGGPAGVTADRLEYAFTATAADGTALQADEYASGRLDWHDFVTTSTTPAAPVSGQLGPLTVVPSAVTYPGMPSSRLWEFEDSRVDFGDIDAHPEDLGRMLLAEFALVYGGDWLLVPLGVPVGALVEITRLAIRDTFGRTVVLAATAQSEWGMFGLSSADGGTGHQLLVTPALAASVQGRAVEDVLLMRDEAA